MGWFLNMKTGQKLTLAFSLCLILAAVIGGISIARMSQMNAIAERLDKDSVGGFRILRDITDDCKQVRIEQLCELAEPNKASEYDARITEKIQEVDGDFTEYAKLIKSDDDRANFDALKTQWSTFIGYRDQFSQDIQAHNYKAATQLGMGPIHQAFNDTVDRVDKVSDFKSKRAQEHADEASSAFTSSRSIVVTLLIAAILIGIFMAFTVTRIITGNLAQVGNRLDSLSGLCLTNLGKAVDALALGDLNAEIVTGTKPLEIDSKDEFGTLAVTVNGIIDRTKATVHSFTKAQSALLDMAKASEEIAAGNLMVDVKPKSDKDTLGNAFKKMTVSLLEVARAANEVANGNLTAVVKPQSEKDILATAVDKMIKNLSELIAQTRQAAENIGTSAEEVSAGNQDLSQRTEEQASSLEETAASMEEMTSTVKQNADNSRQANQLASHARELAEKGGNVVSDAVSAMGEINQGSKKIAEIISVIDEIAFQTNLLALNASVEAARVGEQGRGFAVVAAEVRNLAGRTATAAKEIKSLVSDTVQKVQDGSALVNQSGSQLDEIVSAVKKVADIISEISAASIEQSAGIEQVNKAVMQMDQMTQQNAALVEEAAGTSASMAHLAKDLLDVVAKFKLDDSYIRALQETRVIATLASERAAATGTYGRGARPTKSRPGGDKKTKLHLVSNATEYDAQGKGSADDEFEEF